MEVLSGDVSGRRSNLLAMEQMDLICPSEVEIRDAVEVVGRGRHVRFVIDVARQAQRIAEKAASY